MEIETLKSLCSPQRKLRLGTWSRLARKRASSTTYAGKPARGYGPAGQATSLAENRLVEVEEQSDALQTRTVLRKWV